VVAILSVAVPLAAAMLVTGWRAYAGDGWAAVVLVLLAVAWLRVDKRFEGPRLIRFSATHGVVLSDLATLAAVAVAALGMLRRKSTRVTAGERQDRSAG
jgi:uncharacterized membrane protein